jgi:hypothetical protein
VLLTFSGGLQKLNTKYSNLQKFVYIVLHILAQYKKSLKSSLHNNNHESNTFLWCWLILNSHHVLLCLTLKKTNPLSSVMLPVKDLLIINETSTLAIHNLLSEMLILKQV